MVQRNVMCVLCVFAALCLPARAQQNTPPPAPAAPPPAAAPAATAAKPAAPAADAGSDLVVITVAGQPITEKEVLSAISQLSRQKQVPSSPDQARNVTLFKGALDNIVSTVALKNQAKELNIVPDQAKVNEQMEMLQKRFASPEEFQKALAKQNITEAQLRKNVEDTVKMQQVIDEATKNAPEATEAEIQQFYDANPKAFIAPEQVHAAHILLMVNTKDTPEKKEEVRKKIEEIRADIEAGKMTFEEAAQKYSEDKSNAPKGGDLGFFPHGRMVKSFDEAAFAGQPGTLTPVVETQFGFHIIKIIEHKPAGAIPFEEIKDRIKQYLDQTNRREATQKYVEDLKNKATVETFMSAEEFLKRHPEVQ